MLLQAGFALCLVLAPVQDPASADAALRRDSAFARALAYELRFTDLAEEVLDRALTRAAGAERSRLLLDRCDIRRLAASNARDTSSQVEALVSAAQAYQDFLESGPPVGLANEARVRLGELAFEFGGTLDLLFQTSPPPAERRQELVSRAEGLFKTALQGMNETISDWESMPETDEKDGLRSTVYFPARFYRSMVYFYWATLYGAGSLERKTYSQDALESLEQFVILSGDNTRAGFMGYRFMADTYALRGDAENAEVFYDHVIENCIRADGTYTAPERDGRESVIQEGYLSYLKFLLDIGQTQRARQLGERFQRWIDEQGIILKDPGYRTMLQIARMRILDGDFAEAIRIAQVVASARSQSFLRLEANQVMADAIGAAPPSAAIDLGVLYQAAEGAFLSRKFEESVPLFLMLLGRLEGSRQAQDYGPRIYYYLGRTYAMLGRELESAMCFELGFEKHPDDVEYASRIAELWLKAATRFRDRAPSDAVLGDFYNRAYEAVKMTSAAPDDAVWREAETQYQRAKDICNAAASAPAISPEVANALAALDQARAAYRQIQRGSRYFERAQVRAALCDFRGGSWEPARWERALQAFSEYLDVYIQVPENSPQDARGRKDRAESSAQADYYRGRIRFEQAAAGDAAAWPLVLQEFDGYLQRHPEQVVYGADALLRSLQALLALGRLEEAIALYERLVNERFDDATVASAAYTLFQNYLDASERSEGGARTDAKRLAANYLHVANQRTERPKWQNLVKEARLRLEVGEPATASKLLEETLRRHDDIDAANLFFVRMDLIDAFLAQDNAAASLPVLEQILAEDQRMANNPQVLQAAVRILAGWPTAREGRIVEVPGVGTPEAFAEATAKIGVLQQIAEADAEKAGENRYRWPAYIQARLQYGYILYRWGLVEPSQKGKHLDLVQSFEKLVPDLGGSVCGAEVPLIFQWLKSR